MVRCCVAVSDGDCQAVPRAKNLHSISNTFAKMHIMMVELGRVSVCGFFPPVK